MWGEGERKDSLNEVKITCNVQLGRLWCATTIPRANGGLGCMTLRALGGYAELTAGKPSVRNFSC
jgi:hypothetical protein